MTLVQSLLNAMAMLRTMIATHLSKDRAREDVLAVIWARANRTAQRFTRLFTLWQQGRLKPTHPAKPRRLASLPPLAGGVSREADQRGGPPEPTRPKRPRLPRGKGWVTHIAPPCAAAGGTLSWFLQHPDLPEFLAAVPRAGRLLRPYCRILGVDMPDFLALPPRPRKPRAKPPRPEIRAGKYPRFNPYRYSPGKMPPPQKTGA